MRILVVDDDASMALIARRLLEEEGYGVDVAADGESARLLALVNDYDAIVLDLVLPDGNAIPLIQQLRREGRQTPITVLTGTTDKAVTVRALDAGADDYLTKPIEFDEFKARMRALVRRGGARRTETVTAGNVTLNRLAREVLVGGAAVRVTPRELGLLEHLLLHAGEVVTRTELLEKVFDLTFDPGTNVVDVTVGRLRRKLRDAGATVEIEARRGLGFVLAAVSR
ncbi:MAG: response regulator transcription factor [Gemmatimonadota bacterium]|nr:response regulator transcription factor [Gemmatimonadota bacterium]MDE3128063.1 response regulator transcription factor [Gemmatimonadota bacterium]MDE3172756.1 response regulator transcription factor [Gemmatimonadota bacterium]